MWAVLIELSDTKRVKFFGEVNRRVVFASNWNTSFSEWQSRFKLGFVNSATITKMFNFDIYYAILRTE